MSIILGNQLAKIMKRKAAHILTLTMITLVLHGQNATVSDPAHLAADLGVPDYQHLPLFIQITNKNPALRLQTATLESTLVDYFNRHQIEISDFRSYFMREKYSLHDPYPDHYLEIHIQIEAATYSWELAFHREVLYPREKISYIYSNIPAWQRQGHEYHEQRPGKVITGVVEATRQFITAYQQANCHSN